MTAYFERTGPHAFLPTEHAGGAWNPGEIHFSPLGGLIVHAIDEHRGDTSTSTGKQLARIGFDILGFLSSEPITIEVTTTRPGRTIELVEATAHIAGRPAVVARAWYLAAAETSTVAGGEPGTLPDPSTLESWDMTDTWTGGYVASLEVRPIGAPSAGRTTAWLRTHTRLVAGEEVSADAAFIALVDTANGIAVREKPTEWAFPNVDLTVHFYRRPAGAWVGLDTTVTFGPSGLGLTSSALHDESGPVGRAEQALTVRRLL